MPESEEQVESKLEEMGMGDGDVAVADRPRDEHGRFTTADDPGEGQDQEGGEPEGEEEEGGEQDAPDYSESLSLESEDAPTYDFDEDKTTLKFLGKYETVDEALKGHRHALKRIGQLEHELATRSGGTTAPVDVMYVADLSELTDDQLMELVMKDMGEMTTEERLEAEDNPRAFMAKNAVKVQRKIRTIERFTQQWDDLTKKAYPDVYDDAKPKGDSVWKLYREGKLGPSEFRVILGLGEMVRSNLLSGEKTLTRTKPKGRSPVTTATKPAVTKPKGDPRAEQKAELAEMRRAAYGS